MTSVGDIVGHMHGKTKFHLALPWVIPLTYPWGSPLHTRWLTSKATQFYPVLLRNIHPEKN